MAPIITVHRGELLQIKRMIEKGKGKNKGKGKGKGDLRGDIYGLRTESRQPVIQFVCGQNDKAQTDMLRNGHGLLKLGEWVVQPLPERSISQEDVILVFSDEGDFITSYDLGDEATPDILKGQSAFRLHKPLTKNLDDLAPIPTEEYDKENEHKEAEVTKEQWYSAPEGVKLLQEIYQTFPKYGLTDLNMSRDKATEDISLSLTADSTNIIVHFPPDFPYQNPKVRLDDQNDWSEVELPYEKTTRLEEHPVTLLRVHLWNLVNQENEKRQKQNQSNKNHQKGKKKNKKKSNETEVQIPNQLTSTQMCEHDQQHQYDPSTGQKQVPPMGEHDQPQQDQKSTGQKQAAPTGEHDQPQQDDPSSGQEQAQPMGEHDQPQQDQTSTGQKQAAPTGEHDQQHQDEPSSGQEQAQPIGEHDQPQQDQTSTGQEQATPIGEHEQPRDELSTGQEKATPIGEHEQRDEQPTRQEQATSIGEHEQPQDESSTAQEQATPIGEHERDKPPTGQEQATPMGEHERPDESSTGQEQATPIGEHERDKPPTGQEQATPIGEHERDKPPTGQEQATPMGEHERPDESSTGQEQVSTPRNKTDEVIEQTPEEKMDIDSNFEQLQETSDSVENMEVDEHDHQKGLTKF